MDDLSPARVISYERAGIEAQQWAESIPADPVNASIALHNQAQQQLAKTQFWSPFLKKALELSVAYIHGAEGLKPQARIDHTAVGLTKHQADTLGEEFEGIFNSWANDTSSSTSGGLTFYQTIDALLRRGFATGEGLLSFTWNEDHDRAYKTGCHSVDTNRIALGFAKYDAIAPGCRVLQGIEINQNTSAIKAIHLRPRQPQGLVNVMDIYSGIPERVEYTTEFGRPRLAFSVLDRLGPSAVRGTSPVISAIVKTLRLDSIETATIEQLEAQLHIAWSLVTDISKIEEQKLRAEFSRKDLIDECMEIIDEHIQKFKLRVPNTAKLTILPPGSRLEATRTNVTSSGAEDVAKRLALELAAAFGLPYSEVTGDFSNENYASSRMGQLGPWSIIANRRQNFVVPLYQAAYSAVIEEALHSGRVTIPGRGADFYGPARSLYLATRWFGPAKPSADPLKEAMADDLELQNGTSTLADVCAERGKDWRDVMEQRAAEIEYAKKLGIPLIAGGVDLTTGQTVSKPPKITGDQLAA